MLRVIVVDDHPIIRMGIIFLLEGEGYRIVAETGDGLEALEMVNKYHPDIVLIDIDINSLNGLEVIKNLRDRMFLGIIIVISSKNIDLYAAQSSHCGADGFVSKQNDLSGIITAIKVAQGGYGYFPLKQTNGQGSDVDAEDTDRLRRLSAQEFEVFQQLITGEENKEIALKMGLSNKTVSTYKVRLMRKLGCKNMFELFDFARRTHIG